MLNSRLLMALSRLVLLLVGLLVLVSAFMSRLQTLVAVQSSNPLVLDHGPGPYPDNRLRHVMWFMQISDIHISIFYHPERAKDFKEFCMDTVTVVKPVVVLATGDLTDGKTSDQLGSTQQLQEWKIYQNVLYESGMTGKTVWLDIRGNHDNFNVMSVNSSKNFFRRYSVQGSHHSKSYHYVLHHGSEYYSFIGVDACMEPGPKRPYNFLGILKEDQFKALAKMKEDSLKSNFTTWFGHYPTSTIVSPDPGIRELMRGSGPYFCGHLHTLGGLVPEMYTLQPTGTLELELSDWKDTRRFRVAAVDHGMFSFVDTRHGKWPIILITNPKHAMYTMPSIEPLYRIANSTHIRVLLFSPASITSAQIKIDDGQWHDLTHSEGPLYILAWAPHLYLTGLHMLQVIAKDNAGMEHEIFHQFALDGQRPVFPLGARLTLMGHISVGQAIFGVVLTCSMLILCGFRCIYLLGKGRRMRIKAETGMCSRLAFKLYLLSSVDRLFWPLALLGLYVGIGPWFVGEIIDDHVGALFVWGIFVAGHFIPGGLTFITGSIYLLTFYVPYVLILSHCLYRHYISVRDADSAPCRFPVFLLRHTLMLLFLSWQMVCAVGYYFSYGTMAFFLGILNTWSILLALALWRVAVTLPESCMPAAAFPKHRIDCIIYTRQQPSAHLTDTELDTTTECTGHFPAQNGNESLCPSEMETSSLASTKHVR